MHGSGSRGLKTDKGEGYFAFLQGFSHPKLLHGLWDIGGSGQQDKPSPPLWAQGRAGGHPSSLSLHLIFTLGMLRAVILHRSIIKMSKWGTRNNSAQASPGAELFQLPLCATLSLNTAINLPLCPCQVSQNSSDHLSFCDREMYWTWCADVTSCDKLWFGCEEHMAYQRMWNARAWASASPVSQHLSYRFVSGTAVFTLRIHPSSLPNHCSCSCMHFTWCAHVLDACLTIRVKWLNCNRYF